MHIADDDLVHLSQHCSRHGPGEVQATLEMIYFCNVIDEIALSQALSLDLILGLVADELECQSKKRLHPFKCELTSLGRM